MTQSDGMDLHERRWKLMAGVLPAGPGQQPPPFVVIGPPIPPDEMVEVVEVRTPNNRGAVDRDLLVGLIAAELDKPSVYMGGPSKRSLRVAEAVMDRIASHLRGPHDHR